MGRNGSEDLLSTGEVAAMLGVHRTTALRYIERGDLPAVKLPSGVYRVPREAVERLLRQLADDEE